MLGAIAKAASTYITYPAIRGKTLIYNMENKEGEVRRARQGGRELTGGS